MKTERIEEESRRRKVEEGSDSVSKEGLDSVSKQCMDRTLFLSSVFSGCAVFFFNGESLLLPDHESLSVDRDWRVQSSKNEETLTLIEYATPDERGWSFGSVLM